MKGAERKFVIEWWPSIIAAVFAAIATPFLVWLGYVDLVVECDPPPRGEVFRNYGLLIAAFWGAFIAIWRGQIATRQAETALKQAETANRQADTNERGLQNDRYQKGAVMLGDKSLSARLGGIYALQRLAQGSVAEYHDPVMQLLCAHVQDSRTKIDPGQDANYRCPKEVEAAVVAIGQRTDEQLSRDKTRMNSALGDAPESIAEDSLILDMSRVDLVRSQKLDGANLSYTNMKEADFRCAWLNGSIFSGAFLTGAEFEGAYICGANFSEASLSGANGLTQEKLRGVKPTAPPRNLPDRIEWPFEESANGHWRLKQ